MRRPGSPLAASVVAFSCAVAFFCAASFVPAFAPRAEAADSLAGAGVSAAVPGVAADTGLASGAPGGRVAPHRVLLTKNYYASLCFYGFGQLGFLGKTFNPEYAGIAKELDAEVSDLGFRRPMATGVFYQVAFQLPAYFDPKTPEEMTDLFAAVKRFVRSGSLDEFRKKWPREARALEDWFPGGAGSYFQKTLGGREDVVGKALDVWAQFMKSLWPTYRPDYEALLKDYPFERYEAQLNGLDVFKAWQREFGIEYPYRDLVIIVCPENPTYASSIGPDKVVTGSMNTLAGLKNSVVHEVGTRCLPLSLLFQDPATSGIMASDYAGMLKLVQAEVCYRTPEILPGVVKDPFVVQLRLDKLVAWREKQEATGTLKDVQSLGAAGFMAQLYVRARRDGAL